MLHRAAKSAYSWWWASHVRTKQSKWLEQSLQDMEEKVAKTLHILDDDGETFAKRADTYYRKKPELVNFVEETFRAYRALAERYDYLSKELQSANRTIANAFPDQVQYRIDEEEEEASTLPKTNSSTSKQTSVLEVSNISKKNLRGPPLLLPKKGLHRRNSVSAKFLPTPRRSGMSEAEARVEIEKLQKEILAQQTEKEFVRCLYERSYDKYWEIEDNIEAMQQLVCSYQDEFDICTTIIEDNDARALMAETALNSCKTSLVKLQEVQAQSSEEAKEAYQRVKEAHEKYETLRDQFICKHATNELDQQDTETDLDKNIEEDMTTTLEEENHDDVGMLGDKIKGKLDQNSSHNNNNTSLTMAEMADMIDKLVNKVVTLETEVSSQSGLVKTLRTETDDLQTNIQCLEEEKDMLTEDSDIANKKLKELEDELRRVNNLNQNVKRHDSSLQTCFIEASCDLEHLSGRLNDVKVDGEEEEEDIVALHKNNTTSIDEKPREEDSENHGENLATEGLEVMKEDVKTTEEKEKEEKEVDVANLGDDVRRDSLETMINLDIESVDQGNGKEEKQSKWKQLFASGIGSREKVILEEYTTVLKNYHDATAKLRDVEKKNRDSILELALQVSELKNSIAIKDKEINFLLQKLTNSETNPAESPCTTFTEYKYTPQEGLLLNAAQEINNMQEPDASARTSCARTSSNIDASARTSCAEQQQQQQNENTEITRSKSEPLLPKLGEVRTRLDKHHPFTSVERKICSEIDDLLEENLEFWLKFSTSVHQIQKFQNTLQDLKDALRSIKDNNRSEENSEMIQSETKAIYKHLRDIRTELSLWLEHNAILLDELQCRNPILCNLQDEIARAANPISTSEKAELNEYQAARFQGEVLNMKQENNKVSSELQGGISFVKGLRKEVEKMVEELSQALGVNNHQRGGHHRDPPNIPHPPSRSKMPLRSFLFGVKLRKHRQSDRTQ